ncbi:MAG: dickkopf-related protein [bacterium]
MTRPTAPAGLWLVLALCFGGCGDDLSLGLSGCSPGEPFPSTPENTVAAGAHVTVTAAGTDFLLGQRELLAGLLLDVGPDGWVRLALPPFDFGSANGGLGVGVRDVVAAFDLRTVDLDLQFLADPTRLRIEVRRARIRLDDGVVWVSIGGDAACRLGNGLDAGTPQAALLDADFTVDLTLGVDAESRLQVQVDVLPFTIHGLDFELIYDDQLPECADGVTAAECRLSCGVGDAAAEIGEALYEAFSSQINVLLAPAVQVVVDALVARFTRDPLAIEGSLHPRVLAGLLPTATDAHPLRFRAGPSPDGITLRSAGADGDGIGLTIDIGLDALDHPCVPAAEAPPAFLAGPPPALTGYDHAGQVYHLGLALSDAVVNRAAWTAYRAGVLCAALDSAQIEALLGQRIDTGTLALLLPGLAELTLGPRPIRVALDPRFQAADLPLARFFPVPDDGGVPQAGIALRLPRLGLSFYGLVEERWTRLFAAEVTLAVDLVVQATPDDRLVITVGQPQISDLRQTYNELLTGAEVPALLELISDLLSSALLRDGLAFDLGLAGLIGQVTGLPLDADIAALRVEGEDDDFLSVLLSLRGVGGQGLTAAVDTRAEVQAVRPGQVVLGVEAVGAAAARYQWRLDGGPWRPLAKAPGGVLTVESPALRLLGAHTLAVRAVAEGRYRSLDPTPAEVVVDVEAPPPEPAPAASAATGGCAQNPARGPAPWRWLVWLWLLAVPILRRRGLALALLALGGCDDKNAARDPPCEVSADCPGGLLCFDDRCRRPQPCADSADCCPGAECRGGQCVEREPDCTEDADCADASRACEAGRCVRLLCRGACPGGAACLADRCHAEPPCRGQCGRMRSASQPSTLPRRPDGCAPCGEGEVRVAETPDVGPLCDRQAAVCRCVDAPPIVPADFGRHARMIVARDRAEFAAWDADFQDLVYVTGVEDDAPRVDYLDGVPAGPVQVDPSGPRGGVTAPAPIGGGMWPSPSTPRDAGMWPTTTPTPARCATDAPTRRGGGCRRSCWTMPATPAATRPSRSTSTATRTCSTWSGGGRGGGALRLGGRRRVERPAGFSLSRRELPARRPLARPRIVPAAHGVEACVHLGGDGLVYAAWYDATERWPYLARGGPDGFQVVRLSGERSADWQADPGGRYDRLADHDLGGTCDLTDFQGTLTLVITDATTDALLAWRGEFARAGTFELVDEGGDWLRRLVGADPAVALTEDGRPVAVYQDATDNDVRLAWRDPTGWAHETVATAGALGFYNSLVIQGGELIIGTLELRTTAGGRGAHALHVFRLDAP